MLKPPLLPLILSFLWYFLPFFFFIVFFFFQVLQETAKKPGDRVPSLQVSVRAAQQLSPHAGVRLREVLSQHRGRDHYRVFRYGLGQLAPRRDDPVRDTTHIHIWGECKNKCCGDIPATVPPPHPRKIKIKMEAAIFYALKTSPPPLPQRKIK